MSSTHRIAVAPDIRLAVRDDGTGRPIVLVPGFAQSGRCFERQTGLADRFRLIRPDPRGHGDSDRPGHGYRAGRLATDLDRVLQALDLTDVVLAAHSMGNVVAWSYLEQFGTDRVGSLVIIDRPASLMVSTGGPVFTLDEVLERAAAFRSETTRRQAMAALFDRMVSSDLPAIEREFLIEDALRLPGPSAAELYLNTRLDSWADFLATVRLPTLVIGAEASMIPASAMRTTAALIAGARLEIFSAAAGGSHFMFWENPDRFNELLTTWSVGEWKES